jgi:hypothetical protein
MADMAALPSLSPIHYSDTLFQLTLRGAVWALANAGPDIDPCGGPLKVIVQREKKRANVLVN